MTTATAVHADPELLSVPDELDTAQSKLVYLTVHSATGATVDELSEALGMKKITLLGVLSTLSEENLVERRDGTYVPA